MILLFITLVMITGSVAATDTTSNETIKTQITNGNVVNTTLTNKATNNTVKSIETSNTINNSIKTSAQTQLTKTNTSNISTKSSSSAANSNLTGKQLNTNIKVYDITSTKGSTITIKSSVTTGNGTKVNNGVVVYKINGCTIGNVNVTGGEAKLKYTIPSTWTNINYTINAIYNANNNYARSTSNSTLKIKSDLKTVVTVQNITASQGDNVTLKTVVTTADGVYVKTGKVAFKINGKTVDTAYVSNGGAKLTYTIPNNWTSKTYNITVVYGQNDYYTNSTGTGILTIQGKTNPKIVFNTTSVISGQSATLITSITDGSGKAINGGKVAFKVNGITIGHATVSKGVAKITYTVPTTWGGKYNFTVVYGGYGEYNSITKSTTLTVQKQVATKININTTAATSGQNTTLIAYITDGSGNKVSGGKVAFKLNGKTVGTVNVTKGVANLTYTMPSSWNGKYNISVVYGGYGQYKSSNMTSTVTVTPKTTKTSTTFTVPDGYESYVKSTKNCNVTNSKIQSLAKQLTTGVTSAYQAAVNIYNYVRDNISYTYYLNTKYGSVGTLTKKTGNCVDQTHLLTALMRAVNIPTRYCHATCTFSSGLVVGHVWAEVYVNGKWYSCDTTSSRNSFNVIKNWYKSTTVYRYTAISF